MTSNTSTPPPKDILKILVILHGAFTIAPFIFSLVILFLLENYSIFNISDISTIYYIIPFVALAIIYAGTSFFKVQLSNIEIDFSLKQKLSSYQTASIIRYAMVEGSAFLCIGIALVSEQIVFLIITWCILVYMYSLRPTKEKIIKDLKLNLSERKELNK